MQARYEEIRRLGAEIVIIAQATPAQVAALQREEPFPFPALADPQRGAFQAFGLERTRWTTFLRPSEIARYLRIIFRGRCPRLPGRGEDALQLGGDFIVDRQGRLIYAYRSTTPADRPTVDALLDVLRSAA